MGGLRKKSLLWGRYGYFLELHNDYQNFGAAEALSLQNGEHFISQILTTNRQFVLPVTTRQYITTLARSGNQETQNGESRVL